MTDGATTEAKINNQDIPTEESEQSPSLIMLARDAMTVAGSLKDLAMLELRLAAQSIPKILGLLVVAFFLALFAWLSFSAAAGWLAYAFLDSAGWGIAGFLLLQIAGLIACRFLIANHLKRVSLPNTRYFVKNMKENFRDAAR